MAVVSYIQRNLSLLATVSLVGLAIMMWHFSNEEQSLVHHTVSVKVLSVVDGDTFTASVFSSVAWHGEAGSSENTKGIRIRVRLRAIDAPEKGQQFGTASQRALRQLLISPLQEREVICRITERDIWGRYVADVFVRDGISTERTHVQHAMVNSGMAWSYGGLQRTSELDVIMNEARKKRVGLWSDARPIAPWVYRKQRNRFFLGSLSEQGVRSSWNNQRESDVGIATSPKPMIKKTHERHPRGKSGAAAATQEKHAAREKTAPSSPNMKKRSRRRP